MNMASYSIGNQYKDTWVKVIGSFVIAHFIRQIGSTESVFEILLRPFYYIEVISGTVVALAAWELVSRATSWLDKNYDWVEHSTSRILLQLIFGVIIPSLLIFFLIFLQFKYIIRYDIFQTQWLVYEYPVSILCLIFINGYYIGYYFYNRYQEVRQKLETTQKENSSNPGLPQVPPVSNQTAKPKPQVLIVSKGIKNVPVPVEEIAYFYIHDHYNYLKTFREETFLVSQTLDELAASLSEEFFFRANRQCIVHMQACESYASIENGKLQLFVKPPHKESIIISQKKAREFKEWVRNRA